LRFKEVVLFILILLLSAKPGYTQPRHVKKAIRTQERKSELEDQDYDKRRKKVLKHRFDIQTKEVQDRMKLSEKKSRQYNKPRRDPFYKNLFTDKRRKKR
jgi:hypothetical protein